MPSITAMSVTNDEVAAVQRAYPRIYLACHTRHEKRRANVAALTPQESTLLAHLHDRDPMRAADLARHLGIGAPTLSAALKRLTALGYITRTRDTRDGRALALRRSAKGARAMQDSSVLDKQRVAAMLAQLSTADRQRAIAGLELLAGAAQAVPKRAGAR